MFIKRTTFLPVEKDMAYNVNHHVTAGKVIEEIMTPRIEDKQIFLANWESKRQYSPLLWKKVEGSEVRKPGIPTTVMITYTGEQKIELLGWRIKDKQEKETTQ